MDFERLSKCICSVAQLAASTPQCCYNEAQKVASRWHAEMKKRRELGVLHHFIWAVETKNWSILRQQEMPFHLFASLQRPPKDPHDALSSEWDIVKAQSTLRLMQNALPLAQLNEELRAQFVTHQCLSGLPARLPPGKDFAARSAVGEIFLRLLFGDTTQATGEVLKNIVGFSLMGDHAHKKKLRVPPEAFLLRHVTEDGDLEIRTIGYTFPTLKQYVQYLRERKQDPTKNETRSEALLVLCGRSRDCAS